MKCLSELPGKTAETAIKKPQCPRLNPLSAIAVLENDTGKPIQTVITTTDLVNIENLLDNHVALAEHPDIVETIEKELDIVASYEDKLNVLNKYFGGSTSRELLNERVPGE